MVRIVGRSLTYGRLMTVSLDGMALPVVVRAGAASGVERVDAILCQDHDLSTGIARTGDSLEVAEDSYGVIFAAEVCDCEDPLTASIVARIKSRVLREMSFGAKILRGRWSGDHYEVDRLDFDRGELSVLAFGAGASGTSVRVIDGPDS